MKRPFRLLFLLALILICIPVSASAAAMIEAIDLGEYTRAGDFSEGLVTVYNYDSAAVMDTDGNIVIPFGTYKSIDEFHCGLARAFRIGETKYGFINTDGEMVIEAEYYGNTYPASKDHFRFFEEGVAWVTKGQYVYWNGMYYNYIGLIDREGNELTTFDYSRAYKFSYGYAITAKIYRMRGADGFTVVEEGYGFVDPSGKQYCPYDYFDILAGFTVEGFAYGELYGSPVWVRTDGKYDRNFAKLNIYRGRSFHYGRVLTRLGPYDPNVSRFAFFDTEANRISKIYSATTPAAKNAGIYHPFTEDGLAMVGESVLIPGLEDEGVGGRDVSLRDYYAMSWEEQWELFQSIHWDGYRSKFGFIDRDGNEVIPLVYDLASDFKNGRAWVFVKDDISNPIELYPDIDLDGRVMPGKWGLIDTEGNMIMEPTYDDFDVRSDNGLTYVKLNGKWGLLDEADGRLLCEPQFDRPFESVSTFFEGVSVVELYGRYAFIGEDGKLLTPFKYKYAEPYSYGRAFVKDLSGKMSFLQFSETAEPEEYDYYKDPYPWYDKNRDTYPWDGSNDYIYYEYFYDTNSSEGKLNDPITGTGPLKAWSYCVMKDSVDRCGVINIDLTSGLQAPGMENLPKKSIETAAEWGTRLVFKFPDAEVVFEKEAVKALLEYMESSGKDWITIEAHKRDIQYLGEDMAYEARWYSSEVYEVMIDYGRAENIPVKLALPYELSEEETADSVCAWIPWEDIVKGQWVREMRKLNSTYSEQDGMVLVELKAGTDYVNGYRVVVGYDKAALWSNPFSDVSESDSCYNAVVITNSQGILQGSDGKFSPEKTLTRAEAVQIIYNLEKGPLTNTVNPFTDVSFDAWYADAVTWAYESETTAGVGNDKFAPNKTITRQEFAMLLYNYGESKGCDFVDRYNGSTVFINDRNKIASWASKGIDALLSSKVINYSNSFRPDEAILRSETAQWIANFLKYVS